MQQGIVSLGEALIDFIPTDESNSTYIKSPGGAPANVAVGVARLGVKSTFIGKVGDDVLGHFLKSTLAHFGVRTNQMRLSPDKRTGIVFVTNAADGERTFEFYINPSADQFLTASELDKTDFITHKILHFGSISMIHEPVKTATLQAIQLAKENGMLISYDPNLRMMLWESEEQAHETATAVFKDIDFLKLSVEELVFFTGETDRDKGVHKLLTYEIPLLIVTDGANGSHVYVNKESAHIPAMKVKAIDTTGAGDAFVSGILYSLERYTGDLRKLTLDEAIQMATFASVSGAMAASTKGAMTALPQLEEIEQTLKACK